MTHCACAPLAPRLRWIAGSATLTTVPSMKAMPEPRTALASVQRRAAAPGSGRVAGIGAFCAGPSFPAEALVRVVVRAQRHHLGTVLGLVQHGARLGVRLVEPAERVAERRVAVVRHG